MKKGRASEKVIGQLTQYMGAKNLLSRNNERVKGCIIVYEDAKNFRSSLSALPDIDFMPIRCRLVCKKLRLIDR